MTVIGIGGGIVNVIEGGVGIGIGTGTEEIVRETGIVTETESASLAAREADAGSPCHVLHRAARRGDVADRRPKTGNVPVLAPHPPPSRSRRLAETRSRISTAGKYDKTPPL